MNIRSFEVTDYPAVRKLWTRAGIDIGISDTPAELQRVTDLHPEFFLVGEEAGAIIATVIGTFDGRRAYVYHLAVDPDFQDEGLGTKLLEQLTRAFRNHGILRYHLMIEQDNTGVIDFYEKQGWYQQDLIVMTKDLYNPDEKES